MKRARCFNICQFEENPKTGEKLLFSEDNIIKGLEHKTIKEFAYAPHDADIYEISDEKEHLKKLMEAYHALKDKSCSIEEYISKNQYIYAGAKKNKHWHIVIRTDCPIAVETVAKWFGIRPQYVEVPKSRDKNDGRTFLDCVEYLTHEKVPDKTQYPDEIVHASFDFRTEIDKRDQMRLKYGKILNEKESMLCRILYDGLSLKGAMDENPILYMNNLKKAQEYRLNYIRTNAPLPSIRTNFYISGQGGIGKNVACKALARCLMPEIESSEDLYFEVGGNNVAFEGYDGQPIIIWNDVRSLRLITKFGREEFFDIIDTHPTSTRQNVKYGSIKLINTFNIFNGIEKYDEFLDGLSDGYSDLWGNHSAEDKSQSYRRYFGIINLHENDLDIMINKGIINNTREFEQYEVYKKNGSFAKIAQRLNNEAAQSVENRILDSLVVKTMEYRSSHDLDKVSDINCIPDEFADYGNIIEEDKASSVEKENLKVENPF